ncbi:MAG: L,D-transpeptidase [Acidobacteria bacterium]|nr:L,D-transpeptidase [Acidobacteriota bacterium]
MECPISTSRNGAGEARGSFCTPRGEHVICEKIGGDWPPDTVFVGRRPTAELYTPELRTRFPLRDWILTRILWLEGVEEGRNRGGDVDSRERCIYIHGAPEDAPMGVAGSRGCVRMRNADILHLFDLVEVGTQVVILEKEDDKAYGRGQGAR